MPKAYLGGTKRAKLYLGKAKVRRCYLGSTKIYSAGNTVTYHVGTEIYSEEVDEETSCLSPTTFTPTHDGWEFLGWRENNTASADVLNTKIMGEDPIDLYAVFAQDVVLTLYNGSSTQITYTGTRYYNTENVENASFSLWQTSISGWNADGWATSNSATAGIAVANGGPIVIDKDSSYYGRYSRTIYLYYNGNGANSGSVSAQSGTQYFNSGNYSNPSFQVKSNGFSRTYYNFANWSLNWGTRYNPGTTVTISNSSTMYAMWTAQTTSKTLTKRAVAATSNWQQVRTLVQYGEVFASSPSVSVVGDSSDGYVNEYGTMYASKTYAIVTSHRQTGGGQWNVTVTISGTAYTSAAASGLTNTTGTIPISINNWAGGSTYVNFGKTFKSPPAMNWFSPDPSKDAIANDWNISFSNVSTTGCTISWSKSTGGESKTLGWIAEGYI